MRVTFTKEDMNTSSFLGEGQHSVVITSATDTTSKAGKPMITVEFTAANGKSCMDWFTMEFKKKLWSLALATGIPAGVLEQEGVETAELRGKKLTLVRAVTGKRVYTDKEGVAKEADQFENSYLPLSAGGSESFTQENIPF